MSIVAPHCQCRSPKLQVSPARWPDAVLLVILALLPFLFFWRLVIPNPADRLRIAAGDFTEQYFPLRAFTAQEWVRGELPLWNPYLSGGQPALADIQSGALYPAHVIQALILGWGGSLFGREIGFPLWALEWQVMIHFSLAAVGMYLFMRQLGLESGRSLRGARFGGVIASLVFTYSGYLTGFPVQQITILAVSAWLPWVMWAVSVTNRRVGEGPSLVLALIRAPTSLVWGAMTFTLAILAGHPQTVLYIFYLMLAYTIFRAVSVWQRDAAPSLLRLLQSFARHLVGWLIIIVLGVAIAMAQLLPTVEFINHSLRANLSYQAVSAGLPLNELISIIYPGFFGGSPEYVGIVTLVFIGLAVVMGRPRGEIYFWVGAGLVSLVLAFGGNTFLYSLFYLFAPGFEAIRQQERAFLVYSFSVAILAGCGATALVGPLSNTARRGYALFQLRLRIVIGVIFGLTAFFIYGSAVATTRGDEVNLFYGVLWHHLFGLMMLGGMIVLLILRPRRWLRRTAGMALLALWLALDLFTVNWRFNLEQRDTEPFGPNGVVQFLQTNLAHSPARVASGGLLPGGNSAASVYNLQDLTSNTPLQLAAVDTFFRQMPAWRMWQLMNVCYVVDERDIANEGLALMYVENDRYVFEIGDPFPRTWLVAQTEVIPDEGQAIARLGDDSFDLRRSAVVAVPVAVPLAEASRSTITLTAFSPAYLRATVDTSDNQLLVLSQIYYPGWQAKVDGQPADLLRVNVVQQGVVIPVGEHTVELSFEPASFWWGMVISAIGILGWLVLLLVDRFKKPR